MSNPADPYFYFAQAPALADTRPAAPSGDEEDPYLNEPATMQESVRRAGGRVDFRVGGE
jgi:hypothetical protein